MMKMLSDTDLKEYIKKLKHYSIDDDEFADSIIVLTNQPYGDVAESLYKATFKKFSESEHHYNVLRNPL